MSGVNLMQGPVPEGGGRESGEETPGKLARAGVFSLELAEDLRTRGKEATAVAGDATDMLRAAPAASVVAVVGLGSPCQSHLPLPLCPLPLPPLPVLTRQAGGRSLERAPDLCGQKFPLYEPRHLLH